MSVASTETISLLEEVAEFLEGQADVRDGSDGPRPNRAMSLMAEVEMTIERLKRDSRLGPSHEPEVRLNDDKTLDEIAHPAAHLEQMDFNHWFLEIGPNGNSVAVWLYAKGKITATYERRRDSLGATREEG
jgi:hypothetical protein